MGHGARLHQQLGQEETGGRLELAAEQEGNWLKGAEGDAEDERALDARGGGFDTAREARLKKKKKKENITYVAIGLSAGCCGNRNFEFSG